MDTAITRMFGNSYPIIVAPMFLVSNVEMVVAAAEAGGIGTFPALNFRPIENYRKALQEIRSRTSKPIGVNIIAQKANKLQDEQLAIALENKVDMIICSLGNPTALIKKAHGSGARVFCDVIDKRHARKCADAGADGIIAVGNGAGGHGGEISPFALIPYLKKATGLPVIAAGNIVDGKGLLAALALGASAAYMGTRFIATQECAVSEEYKKAILNAGCESIVSTHKVDGFPGNFIKTPLLETLGLKTGPFESFIGQSKKLKRWLAMSRAYRSLFAVDQSKISYKTVFAAGQGVGLIDSVKSCREIIDETMAEYQQLKSSLP